ncbi:MAG: anaerobic glycerol-3-phosphate dehydrogenase subunit A [Pseudomonadota bacterium]
MSNPCHTKNTRPQPGQLKVVVIGGGATGCAVARDLCLRGFSVTLIEYGDLGSGSSSRFHGMLQSGARYAVSDTAYAAECMRERQIVASLCPSAVEQTDGLFISLPEDPPQFADLFYSGCQAAQIPVEELAPEEVSNQEPALSRSVVRAFSVPDAAIHSWRLVNLLADDIRHYGGCVLTRHQVTGIERQGSNVTAVTACSQEGGKELIFADAVVNATGPWAGRIARLGGGVVDLQLTKGSILVFAHRFVKRAINRCRPPTSHDIMVPTGTVSLFGTTSEVVDSPDVTVVRPAEIQELLDNAESFFPGIRERRILRAWAGVRPLVKPESWESGKPLPRRHSVIHHASHGLNGFFTVSGGSLTTHRSMAEDVVNQVCRHLGINLPCRTATTPLVSSRSASFYHLSWSPTANHQIYEDRGESQPALCECEAVDRSDVEKLISEKGIEHLHDIRRRLRVGFGPCQGSFCGCRLANLIAQHSHNPISMEELTRFWTERLKGSIHVAWHDQARQILLSDTIYRGTMGLQLYDRVMPSDEQR